MPRETLFQKMSKIARQGQETVDKVKAMPEKKGKRKHPWSELSEDERLRTQERLKKVTGG